MSKPIIQCITNDVTKNDCANAVIAVGASPIMAHHIQEVADVQNFAAALLLNLGATMDFESMRLALKTAKACHHPVVLDPVGIAGIPFRREFAQELLKSIGGITCIRGNYNEIAAILENKSVAAGLDAGVSSEDRRELLAEGMKRYAKETGILLIASGAVDIVSDGEQVCFVESGHEMMSRITGSGCMASAVLASRLAFENSFETAVRTMKIYGECGERAAEAVISEHRGTGTFHQYFMDELSLADWTRGEN